MRKKQKRASYRYGVNWIAWNDEPTLTGLSEVADQISVLLLADLFGHDPDKVAADVVRYRRENSTLMRLWS